MGSNSSQDLSIYKTQQVLVYSSAGAFIGAWADAPLLAGFKEAINAATTPLSIELPRSFETFNSDNTIAQGNNVQFWLFGPGLPSTGLLRFQGVIDSYEPQIKDNGEESVAITITPYDSVLGDHAVTGTVTFGTVNVQSTYVDPVTMYQYFFNNNDPLTGVSYMSPLTNDATSISSSSNRTAYIFTRQTMLDTFNTIMQMLPASYFYRSTPSKTVILQSPPVTAQHVLYVGQNVTNPLYKQDWMVLKNVVVFKGGANNKGVTLYVTVAAQDVSTFGERVMLVEDNRVTDPNTAATLALGYLAMQDRVLLRAKVRVPDYRGSETSGGSTGLGYDIESLAVGDTIQIIDPFSTATTSPSQWDVAQWNVDYWDYAPTAALTQVVQIIALTYNFDYVDLELGYLQPSQDKALFDIQTRYQKFALN